MDLAEAPSTVVTSKVMDIVDSIPPRTPEKNRKEYVIKEFKKRYTNVPMSDAELEAAIDIFLQFAK